MRDNEWYLIISLILSHILSSHPLSLLSLLRSLSPMEIYGSPHSNISPISHSLWFSVVLVHCDDVIKEQSGVLSLSLSVSSLISKWVIWRRLSIPPWQRKSNLSSYNVPLSYVMVLSFILVLDLFTVWSYCLSSFHPLSPTLQHPQQTMILPLQPPSNACEWLYYSYDHCWSIFYGSLCCICGVLIDCVVWSLFLELWWIWWFLSCDEPWSG